MKAKLIITDLENNIKWQQSELEPEKLDSIHQVSIYPTMRRQTIQGFGGAFTEAAAWCSGQLPAEKRQQVLNDAMQSGLLHDIGKVSVLELSTRTVRQWQEEEYEVTCLHTAAGHLLLSERASTERFAPVALGHHAWYDGSAYGYPATYKRLECPSRQMVDVVGLIDWIEAVTNSDCSHTGIVMTFDEAVEEAIALEGRQFSPLLTARLRDKQVTEKIRQAFEAGRREAYRQMYEQERERDDP